jgi:hypothetical protein
MPTSAADRWNCDTCSFPNHVLLPYCELCGTHRLTVDPGDVHMQLGISAPPSPVPAAGVDVQPLSASTGTTTTTMSTTTTASASVAGAALAANTCGICLEDFDLEEDLATQTFGCLADHPYCNGCITAYLSHGIAEGSVATLQCPHSGCETMPSLDGLRAETAAGVLSLDAADIQRFERLMTIQTDRDARVCSKCGELGRVRRSRLTRRVIKETVCGGCGHSYCAVHGDAHGAFDKAKCRDYSREERADETAAKDYKRRNTKKCPNRDCAAPIEKASGCNEMFCTRCHTSMCWSCGGKMGDNHFEFWNLFGCPLSQHVYSRPAVYAIKGGMAIGLIVGAAVAVPVGLVGLPIYATVKGIRRVRRRRRQARMRNQQARREPHPEMRMPRASISFNNSDDNSW